MQMIWLRRSGNWIEQHPLLFALGVSLAVHVLLFTLAATALGVALLRDPELLKQIAQSPEKIIELTAQKFETAPPRPDQVIPEPEQQMPMLFVEVDPSLSETEEPKKAKYYAAQNSLAANPDTKLDTDQPKIDGRQTEIVRAFDAPRSQPKPMPLQPSPKSQPKVEAQPERRKTVEDTSEQKNNPAEQPKQARGGLDMLRPPQNLQQQQAAQKETPRERPKTLAEAMARESDHRPTGDKMKQDGGVKRFATGSTLQAIGTPVGRYDAIIIDAIKNAWLGMVQDNPTIARQGRVEVSFRLHSNGRISELRVVNTSVDSIQTAYCQIAIDKPSPFPAWPDEVKREFRTTYRDVTFTFLYQ